MRTALITTLLLLIALGATADDRYPHGRWTIGLDAMRSWIEENSDDDAVSVEEVADGGALQVGWMASPNIQLRLYSGAAEHSSADDERTFRYGAGTIDLVYLFRRGATFRPYLAGGLGGFHIESQTDAVRFESDGAGTAFGAGFHLHLNRRLALHGQLRLETVNWETNRAIAVMPDGSEVTVETPVEDSGASGKASIGGMFWF